MKDKKFGILLLGFGLIFGCGQKTEFKKPEPKISDFKILENYTEFALKMENSDTIKLLVNLSMCDWEEFDRIEITKTNDSVYLQIQEKIMSNDTPVKFPKVLYELENDTLNLENIMASFDINHTEKISGPFFVITNPNENDTIILRTIGLGNRGKNILKYQQLMMELYPKEMERHYNTYFGMTFREFNKGTIIEE